MSIRVLYSFPTRLGVPGIGTTAWYQVKGLVDLGLTVSLYCGSLERPIPGLHRCVETMRYFGLRLPYRLVGDDRAFRLHDSIVANELRLGIEHYDVYHGWPLGSLSSLHTAREVGTCGLLERPNTHTAFAYEIVAREHCKLGLPLPHTHSHAFNSERLRREEAEYAIADRLLCPSDFVARTFLERGFAPGQIARHQYGYDPRNFRCNGSKRNDPRFTALFVGRCEPRKGLHFALQAWEASGAGDNGRFLICGEFVPGYRKLLSRWLDGPSVSVSGFTDDVSRMMCEADVLVLPSIEEGSALVTYEARGAGCVVLASDAAGAVGGECSGVLLHPVGDTKHLAQQLTLLSSNREELQRLRHETRAASAGLTWEAAAQVLCEIYHHECAAVCGSSITS